MMFKLPKKISPEEALRQIAYGTFEDGSNPDRRLSRENMIALARIACLTYGLTWSPKIRAREESQRVKQ